MKKYIFLSVLFAIFLGCASFHRGPASIDKSRFAFHLYGGAAPQGDYQLDLLDLNALKNKKVDFKKFDIDDPQTIKEISLWQDALVKTRQDLKDGIHFDFQKYSVAADNDDIDNLIAVLEAIDATETNQALLARKKAEAIAAFNERFRSSIENNIEVLTSPFTLLTRLAYPNIRVQESPAMQVPASSFWTPRSSKDVDMWNGPGKFDFTKIPQMTCHYRGAKTGFGVHAGFKIKCGDTKLKLKFGSELYSGPFNSRIYHRLGFNVPAIHYVPLLNLKYDRRVFTEINNRRPQGTQIKMAGVPVYKVVNYRVYDAMEFVTGAKLKDGSVLPVGEFKKRLVPNCNTNPCDYSDSNVDTNFEKQVDTLTFQASSITEPIGEEIGPWSYGRLDHPHRTELKALLLLGGWTGNYDLRKDNNSLVWVKKTGELKHFISDPGSGLGNQTNPFFNQEKFSGMKWTVSAETRTMEGDTEVPSVYVAFRSLEDPVVFRNLSYAEGQWIARQIASISEDEISEALAASGLSAAELLLAREKLVSIQQNYIQTFGLKKEFSQRLRKINKHLNFDPTHDQVIVHLHNGNQFRLETRNVGLKNGGLVYGWRK